MKKTFMFRVFGLGAIPKSMRPALEAEGIVVADEGMGGWFITKDVKAPGKRYIKRSEGFSGCLVITKNRIICYTYAKRQINIAVDDPKVSYFHVSIPKTETFSLSFESSHFRDRWEGVIEYRFNTEKAQQFFEAFKSLGAQYEAKS